MNSALLISDAAKKVEVEAHVLRYWEEELGLPIKRNELGHRYYTEEDVKRFLEIKDLKEKGLQLKAIRIVLKNGRLDLLSSDEPPAPGKMCAPVEQSAPEEVYAPVEKSALEEVCAPVEQPAPEGEAEEKTAAPVRTERIVLEEMEEIREDGLQGTAVEESGLQSETNAEKLQRLQWLLQQLFRETLRENNEYLCHEMKDGVLKELDYQFRMLEEREEERNSEKVKRDEEHYRKIDDLLRRKRKLPKK